MKYRFIKNKNTYAFALKFKKPHVIVWQFSMKNMWLFPKFDKNYTDKIALFGWLFFYIGYHKYAEEII